MQYACDKYIKRGRRLKFEFIKSFPLFLHIIRMPLQLRIIRYFIHCTRI